MGRLRGGFSLIELVAVVALLALVAALVIPNLRWSADRSVLDSSAASHVVRRDAGRVPRHH